MADLCLVFQMQAVFKDIHDGIQVELLVVNDHYLLSSIVEDFYSVQSILREDRLGVSLSNWNRLLTIRRALVK